MVLTSRWLKECNENHKDYRKRTEKTFLPTRLIDVGEWDGTQLSEPRIHVTDTDNVLPVPPYITLSHCWGSIKILQLLQETFNGFRTRIVFTDLPKTFQHAIEITRQMKIRYLWVDSLCIFQDDRADWLRESAMMAAIYETSYCNICATAAADGSVGCFFPRDCDIVAPLKMNASWGNLDPGAYYVIDNGLWAARSIVRL